MAAWAQTHGHHTCGGRVGVEQFSDLELNLVGVCPIPSPSMVGHNYYVTTLAKWHAGSWPSQGRQGKGHQSESQANASRWTQNHGVSESWSEAQWMDPQGLWTWQGGSWRFNRQAESGSASSAPVLPAIDDTAASSTPPPEVPEPHPEVPPPDCFLFRHLLQTAAASSTLPPEVPEPPPPPPSTLPPASLTGPPPAPPGLLEAPASSTPPPAPLASSTPPIESTVAAQQPERRWARRTQTRVVVTGTIVEEISRTPLSQAPPPAAQPVFSQTGGGHCPPMHPAPDDINFKGIDDAGLQRARMAAVPWRNAFERRCYAFCG